MGTAKFFEEKLERTHRELADSADKQVHPTIAKSRSIPGRVAKKLTAEAATLKRQRVSERFVAKQQQRQEQIRIEAAKRASAVEAKARELLSALQPNIVRQNERLSKHVRFFEALVKSQALEISILRRRLVR